MSDGGVRPGCDTLTECEYAENDRKQKEAQLFNIEGMAPNAPGWRRWRKMTEDMSQFMLDYKLGNGG